MIKLNIQTVYESERGCGYRQEGGQYLMGGSVEIPCGFLPIELTICQCCNQGIKPTRGFTWIFGEFFRQHQCAEKKCKQCEPFFEVDPFDKLGLIWIGEKYYPTPEDFMRETVSMGMSRRIPAVPKGFEMGETWVMFAHRKVIQKEPAIVGEDGLLQFEFTPAIFSCCKPDRIEYIVRKKDTKKKLKKLEDRGIKLMEVKHAQLEIA